MRRCASNSLGLALTNIANTIDSQTQNISTDITFDMIAKELEAEYNATNARVDIEREDFLAKVVDRLSETLTAIYRTPTKLLSLGP